VSHAERVARPAPFDRGSTSLTAETIEAGISAGLDAVGVAGAAPFWLTRRLLRARKAAGLHGGMAFTYRNPERSTDPSARVPGAASLVVGARSYRQAPPDHDRGTLGTPGRVARYAWTDSYAPLRAGLGAVAAHLRSLGYRAVVVADDNALVDRAAAVRAGLGWYGKNANVLLPGHGSWFVLGSVVTDASLERARERVGDGCGGCRRCLSGCPTGAIIEPGVVDARRCLAWLLQATGPFPIEFRETLGDRIYGCDDCQEVCPHNQAGEWPASREEARPSVNVVELLALGDEKLLAAAGRWYVPERDARYLRRNALVVLGNVGDPCDPAVVEALKAALRHPDGLVRAHAVWAARRLGLEQLARPLAVTEADPMVRRELTREL
jgi:epoxyqueuosine reductase